MKLDTHEEIREFYDRNLNMTLLDLSCETGLTVPELKKILMEGSSMADLDGEREA